eukprot:NODE_2740_length_1351_cov_102.843648_g2603_i0.p1 GENE.NODE_2740_length_1351_cov_102.843648_g2603_i0~~NODE_2740_length_1351_cov_102.843648_g2603_i0.p1  ORF type:complete len:426 (+),score=71.68 NODE_2740_length_1351_cov_102.843648_g2603_i0:52-1278(+)
MTRVVLVMFVWLGASVLGGRLHLLTTDENGGLQAGVMDPSTGTFQGSSVKMPPAEVGCKWIFLNGTHGQTSTSFYVNQTMFFLAAQQCSNAHRLGSTGDSCRLLTLFKSFALTGAVYTMAKFPEFDTQRSTLPKSAQTNILWDYAANVIVIHRVVDPKDKNRWSYITIEVSDYDGQKRPKANMGSYPMDYVENDYFQRVDGLAGLSTFSAIQPFYDQVKAPEEMNCGDNCTILNLEQRVVDFQPVNQPRYLIGRNLFNGTVISNATDPTQLQSITYHPRYRGLDQNMFFGLGICCELSWCPRECEGHGTHFSLVTMGPHPSFWPDVAYIMKATAPDPYAARLGVAVDFAYPVDPSQPTKTGIRVSVWANGRIESFAFDQTSGERRFASTASSPVKFNGSPLAWAYLNN